MLVFKTVDSSFNFRNIFSYKIVGLHLLAIGSVNWDPLQPPLQPVQVGFQVKKSKEQEEEWKDRDEVNGQGIQFFFITFYLEVHVLSSDVEQDYS